MKTAAEWSNDYFFGKKIGTIAELVREVRDEALEEAAKIVHLYDGSSGVILIRLEEAIRRLKEKP